MTRNGGLTQKQQTRAHINGAWLLDKHENALHCYLFYVHTVIPLPHRRVTLNNASD